MKIKFIEAKTINEAWFLCIKAAYNCITEGTGREYVIERGSYANEQRRELYYAVIHIEYPNVRPLIPDVPCGMPLPTTMQYVENYCSRYLLSNVRADNEQYTYGERLQISRDKVIERYIKHGYNNNQQILAVGQPSDIDLDDPPCLRQVDTKICDNKLNFIIYFRSWDLWSGFPVNLAGLQLYKEKMVEDINSGVTHSRQIADGAMIITSKGLHLYGYAWELARIKLGLK